MDGLPPIVPQPAPGSGWDIVRQCLLQLAIQIEIRTTREPINSVLLKVIRCVRWKSHLDCASFGVGVGSLIRVMHALPCIAGDELDVHFLIVVLVEEGAVTCASDCAGLHRSAYATVENIFILSRDLGAENGRCALASGYFELESFTVDSYIGRGVKLGVRR